MGSFSIPPPCEGVAPSRFFVAICAVLVALRRAAVGSSESFTPQSVLAVLWYFAETPMFTPPKILSAGTLKYPTKCPCCAVVLCGDPDVYPTENSFGGDPKTPHKVSSLRCGTLRGPPNRVVKMQRCSLLSAFFRNHRQALSFSPCADLDLSAPCFSIKAPKITGEAVTFGA